MTTQPTDARSTTMPVPQFMPILSAGCHESPKDGACVMEYASFLAGEEWTDTPACVNPHLAVVARCVNDRLPNDERQQMLALLPRLMGTAADVDIRVPMTDRRPCDCGCGSSRTSWSLADLVSALDEYDRLTSRETSAPLEPADLARLAALTA